LASSALADAGAGSGRRAALAADDATLKVLLGLLVIGVVTGCGPLPGDRASETAAHHARRDP
jgi:hypothetical protein